MVFRPTSALVDLLDWLQWWEYGCWVLTGVIRLVRITRRVQIALQRSRRRPRHHPVGQVAYPDSTAYAR